MKHPDGRHGHLADLLKLFQELGNPFHVAGVAANDHRPHRFEHLDVDRSDHPALLGLARRPFARHAFRRPTRCRRFAGSTAGLFGIGRRLVGLPEPHGQRHAVRLARDRTTRRSTPLRAASGAERLGRSMDVRSSSRHHRNQAHAPLRRLLAAIQGVDNLDRRLQGAAGPFNSHPVGSLIDRQTEHPPVQ